MSSKSKIGWTDATWNVIAGCTKVSAGCKNCYALSMSRRLAGKKIAGYVDVITDSQFNGKVALLPDRLKIPLHWKKPRTIFVESMGDLFHPKVPFGFIDKVWDVMARCPQHTFQILTKRPERMAEYVNARLNADHPRYIPLQNVWIGTSVENAKEKHRIDTLRKIPAAVRFLSLEPLLGDLGELDLTGIHWVIVGGESGPGWRPMDIDWALSIQKQCAKAGVPFFFKQHAGLNKKTKDAPVLDGRLWHEMPERIQT